MPRTSLIYRKRLARWLLPVFLFIGTILMGIWVTKQFLGNLSYQGFSNNEEGDNPPQLDWLLLAIRRDSTNALYHRRLAAHSARILTDPYKLRAYTERMGYLNSPYKSYPLWEYLETPERQALWLLIEVIIPHYRRALELSPLDAEGCIELGWAYHSLATLMEVHPGGYRLSRHYIDMSKACFQRALELAPKDTVIKKYVEEWQKETKVDVSEVHISRD